ncbi:bifunctional UDP-sugar hydrolase/5'-nucleotidase [Halalkalicoccus tibetensis]|uniref:Bifunctional UDP-sugar hydrolase/5'-nucleotidase n=1 Tax=Halalkalicoccus tibetensis TaxID=175632 RepID=A0ABD5V349_9EURY
MSHDCGGDHEEYEQRGTPAGDRSTVSKRGHASRRTVLGAAAAGLAGTALSGAAGAENGDGGDTVTIVHDLHSHSDIGEVGEPNIARYQATIRERLAEREDSVFLTSGDELGSSLISFYTEGAHKVEFMNDMGITAAGVGNHDFDYGIETAIDRFGASEFPWLNSALFTPDGEPLPNTERWRIVEVGDVTLGLFNVVLRGFHDITDYPDEYEARDPIEVSREMVDCLQREGADVIVLASHVAHETHYEIAEAVDGLDAIFGSHSHVTFDEAEIHHGTVISEIGYAYEHLGVMTLDREGGLVSWERVDLDEGIEPDPEFKARLEAQYDELDEEFSAEVGETEVELDASGAVNYARESRLGNLVADAMLDAGEDADVAFQNAGGLRTNDTYGPGTLTAGDVLGILPFANAVVTFEATGAEIRAALESRVDTLPEAPFGAQQGQQVGGLSYEWSGHGEAAIGEVFVDGEPLDPEGSYTVATTDYIKDTASGYDSFRGAEVLWQSSDLLGPVVMQYIEEQGSVAPEIEDRILRVDEDVGEQTDWSMAGGELTLWFDLPEEATGIDPEGFFALAPDGERFEAAGVEEDGGAVAVTFDGERLPELASGETPLRVFGGFDPDSEAYGYTDEDGALRELPVSAAYGTFVMKGSVTAPVDG